MKAVKEAHLKGKMMKESKFECGEIYLTTGANSLIAENAINIIMLLSRHGSGDWGDLCDEDKKANDSAIGTARHDRAAPIGILSFLSGYSAPLGGGVAYPIPQKFIKSISIKCSKNS